MAFTSELVVQQTGDFEWRVVKPLSYEGHTDTFTVTSGSTTDFASVPGIFQWLIPREGRYTKPAVLHDFLCRNGEKIGCPIADADGVFRRAMAELNVPFLRRWVMWAAVRCRSLWNSRGKAGPSDIPQVLLIAIVPGLFVLFGGAIVFLLLCGWFVIEAITMPSWLCSSGPFRPFAPARSPRSGRGCVGRADAGGQPGGNETCAALGRYQRARRSRNSVTIAANSCGASNGAR
jgi:hypothetical protein